MTRLHWNLRTTISERPIPFFSDGLSAYIIAYYNNNYYVFSTYHNSNFFDPNQIFESKPEAFKKYALKSKHKTLNAAKRKVRRLENKNKKEGER